MAAINRRWSEAGHEGSISNSVFYKIKRELGESGDRSSVSEAKPEASEGGTLAAGRRGAPQRAAGRESVKDGAARTVSSGSDLSEKFVDDVEAGIDDLIFTLRSSGGLPEVEAALRAARRMLARRGGGS